MRIIAISGADGSGKSTYASALESHLRASRPDLVVARAWLRWSPRQTTGGRAQPSPEGVKLSTVARSHKGHPLKRVARRIGAGQLWGRLAASAYSRQLKYQLGAFSQVDVLIADRYVVDFAADLVAGGVVSAQALSGITARLRPADLSLLATVPDDVLLARRESQDDPSLLVERAALYRSLAPEFGARPIDTSGALSFSEVDDLMQVWFSA